MLQHVSVGGWEGTLGGAFPIPAPEKGFQACTFAQGRFHLLFHPESQHYLVLLLMSASA